MERVEEITVVRASVAQTMRMLTSGRFAEWVAPDVTATPTRPSATLAPGDRFQIEILGGVRFEYLVEAISDREVVFSFSGPWSGRERWSFVADGAETIVRRVYELDERSPIPSFAWRALGRPVVSAHYKLELARFRAAVERDPGPRAEIERGESSRPASGSYPVDEG
jgi:hypothetical protein